MNEKLKKDFLENLEKEISEVVEYLEPSEIEDNINLHWLADRAIARGVDPYDLELADIFPPYFMALYNSRGSAGEA